jgi:translation initiation factor 1
VRVAIDRKRGRGRPVTVASGFRLTAASLDKLATELKKRCGAGGSSSGSEIVIQGEKVNLVAEILQGRGFRVKR